MATPDAADAATPASEPREGARVMLILDASGSMWGRIEGQTKIEIARTTIRRILAGWHQEDWLGLMAYGHRSRTDCGDIEVLHRPAPLDANAFNAAVARIKPKGMTPMTEAVRRAAAALGYTKRPATIVLVTDGEETCHADPCAVAEELARTGVRLTIHVVGFDIDDAKTKAQLACFTEKTGGLLLDAHNAGELTKALTKTVEVIQKPPPVPPPPPPAAAPPPEPATVEAPPPAPPPVEIKPATAEPKPANPQPEPKIAEPKSAPVEPHPVAVPPPVPVPGPNLRATARLVADGPALDDLAEWKVFADDLRWQLFAEDADASAAKPLQEKTGGHAALTVDPGQYRLRATLGNLSLEQAITVAADRASAVDVVLGVGAIVVAARAVGEVGVAPDQVRVDLLGEDGKALAERYGDTARFVAKPGSYRIRASLNQAVAERDVIIAAGQITRMPIAVGIGRIVPHVVLPLDNSEVTGEIDFAVLAREKSPEGEDVTIKTAHGRGAAFDLPSGRYRLRATVGRATGESEIDVVAGETTPVQITLGVGRLVARVYRGEGGKEVVDHPYFTVLAPERNAQGLEVTIATAAKAGATFDLPIGRYKLRASVGQAVAETEIEIAPGAVTVGKVVLEYGQLVAHAYFGESGSEVVDDVGFRVLALERGKLGEEVTIATAYKAGATFDLPTGRYKLRATSGKAVKDQEIEIRSGETTTARFDLEAGIVAVAAPGAGKIEIHPFENGVPGKLLDRSYDAKHRFVVPAGRYLVRAFRDTGARMPLGEKTLDLKAGDRVDIALP